MDLMITDCSQRLQLSHLNSQGAQNTLMCKYVSKTKEKPLFQI